MSYEDYKEAMKEKFEGKPPQQSIEMREFQQQNPNQGYGLVQEPENIQAYHNNTPLYQQALDYFHKESFGCQATTICNILLTIMIMYIIIKSL
ncbi:hypothetical protein pb186bvf_005929 [Paramecium bursaria]